LELSRFPVSLGLGWPPVGIAITPISREIGKSWQPLAKRIQIREKYIRHRVA
jgi:hypothetical protein